MTRNYVSDWGDGRTGYAMRLYRAVLEHAVPIAVPERYDDDWVVYSRLCLPLGTKDDITHFASMLTPVKEQLDKLVPPTIVSL